MAQGECIVVCEWSHLSDLDPHGHPTSVNKNKVEKNHPQVIAKWWAIAWEPVLPRGPGSPRTHKCS